MFDPYRKWLGIPEDQRPPNHYQLLGIAPDEQDAEVIEAAAVRQSAFVRNFQSGKYGNEATRLLTEIAAARICLLDPGKRAAYDAEMQRQRTGAGLRSTAPTVPRRSAAGGTEPDLGFAPLEDVSDQPAADAETPAPAPTPARQRPSKTPSQSSARYGNQAPPASPSSSTAPPGAPAHRTPAPASMPPTVDLGRLVPQAAAPRVRPSRLGPARPANYAKPFNPIGLVWQIPLLVVLFIALVLIANAVGRKIAASRSPIERVPAASVPS